MAANNTNTTNNWYRCDTNTSRTLPNELFTEMQRVVKCYNASYYRVVGVLAPLSFSRMHAVPFNY